MKTIIEKLEEEIPHGKHCNPDTSRFPRMKDNCPYNIVAIYCNLHEEMKDNNIKICGINERD
tara:strand:- start:72 stop:257 length:186 start_codon:yes stop_codon:yes gene_type:complete